MSFNSAKVPIDMNDAINNLYKSIFSSIIRIKSTICPSPLPQPVLRNNFKFPLNVSLSQMHHFRKQPQIIPKHNF